MDPLAQMYQTESIQPTRKRGSSQRSDTGSGILSDNRSLPETRLTPTQAKSFTQHRNSPSHSSLSSALSVPDDDRSDVESIASTGPMLDDDQVELLTMEFSEEVFNEEEAQVRKLDRRDSQNLSLPPSLSYLERYIRQTSYDMERMKNYKSDEVEVDEDVLRDNKSERVDSIEEEDTSKDDLTPNTEGCRL